MKPILVKVLFGNCGTIDQNTKLYCPFNEGIGDVAKDYSQYGNNAVLTDIKWGLGGGDNTGIFNGESSYGNCGNDVSLEFNEEGSKSLVRFFEHDSSPVIPAAIPGSWDENTRERLWVLYEDGNYYAWYAGWKGTYDYSTPNLVHLGYATSPDGITWTKYAGNPVYNLTWTEDICVVKNGDTYYMYAEDEYTGDGEGTHIDLLSSTDRINWTRYGTVLSRDGSGWEGTHVGTPTVWIEGTTWYMLYEGIGSMIAGQVGLATSSDGKNWTRYENNPVLSSPYGEGKMIAIDSIIKRNGIYYAYGHGPYPHFDLFTSTDLISWVPSIHNPLNFKGLSPVIVDNGTDYLLYNSRGYLSLGRSKGAFSIEIWVYPTEEKYEIFVGKGDIWQHGYHFMHYNANNIGISLGDGTRHIYIWEDVLTLNAWQHLILIVDRDSGAKSPTLFVNGISKGAKNISPVRNSLATTDNVFIGAFKGNNWVFNGTIGECKIHNWALCAEEVLAHFNDTKVRFM